MKRLTLIRHAKSDRGMLGYSDFDRPLNSQGEQTAQRLGKTLKQQQIQFDQIFSSPAQRSLSTTELICEAAGTPTTQIITDPSLYTFDMEELYRFIEGIDDTFKNVAIIGHNPAITLLANDITFACIDHVPPCGVVRIQLDINEWVAAHSGTGQLIEFDYPKAG